MSEFRLSRAAALLGVSDDTVRRWVDAGRLASHLDPAGARVVAGRDLATLAVELAGEAPEAAPVVGQSARNHFPGIVTRVVRGDVAAQVEIQAGPHRVVALLTREAVDELGLTEGVAATASVKATNVTVEVRGGTP